MKALPAINMMMANPIACRIIRWDLFLRILTTICGWQLKMVWRYLIKTGNFTNYSVAQGLAHESVTAIAEDAEGDIWFTTMNGLSRFNPKTQKFRNFSKANGIAGNIMSKPVIYAAPGGLLLVGSTQGLAMFNPANLLENTLVPPVF